MPFCNEPSPSPYNCEYIPDMEAFVAFSPNALLLTITPASLAFYGQIQAE